MAISDERYKLVEDLESVVDRYEDKLGTYLVKLTGTGADGPAERGRLEVPAHDLRLSSASPTMR